MSKVSQRKKPLKGDTSADVHTRIAAEAAAVRSKDQMGFQPAEETPSLCALLDSASGALSKAVPATFNHQGRPYYLRVAFARVHVMVFESATSPEPMALAVTGSSDEFGHTPYH